MGYHLVQDIGQFKGVRPMEAVAYSTFRANLRSYIDKVRDDAEPILVTSRDPDSNVIVLNVREYENMRENLYIRSNEYLYEKLKRGMEQARAGKFTVHEIIEDDDD